MRLVFNCWYDLEDPEHLVHFTIRDGDKQLWDSSWHDIREFFEDKDLIDFFREEVRAACMKYNIADANLDSKDYHDWTDSKAGVFLNNKSILNGKFE